ncbi:glycosyltransferase [Candidatus Parcubacteria bacterium]|nr:MAG: glycosyltransferase [Candidatus Parcubacteria bacterium]
MENTSVASVSVSKRNSKYYVLLPSFNEIKSLPVLIPKLKKVFTKQNWPYHIIICDDGSNDGTCELLSTQFSDMPISVIKHKRNRGLGETIRDLFEHAAEVSNKDDIIIRMDCDDTHDPSYIPAMISKMHEGYDVVIASRFAKGGGQTGVGTYRSSISFLANIMMKIFLHIPGIFEYSCGFRAYRASVIKKAIDLFGNSFIQLMGLGFTCTLEKLTKLKLMNLRFAEVPFRLHYDRKQSSSKMITSLTTLGYISLIVCYHWPYGGWKSYIKKLLLPEVEQKTVNSVRPKLYNS